MCTNAVAPSFHKSGSALPHEITFKAGYSKGFDCNHEDFMRLAVEVEF